MHYLFSLKRLQQCSQIKKNEYKGDEIMADIKYEIKETVGLLSKSPKGWTKELNLISWNGKEPKYDLRDWDAEHEKMGKGVTLTKDELKTLRDVLNEMKL